MEFNRGDIIYKYELIDRLGKGSFGEVWLANDTLIDKRVALKILPSSFGDIAKQLNEAKNGNKVSHKNLLTIYYADVVKITEDHIVTLIAQEFLKNGTIENKLNAQNFLPLPDLIKVLTDILLGLEYLHNGGVIHNDIKPSNILLDEYGNGILADYGISCFSKDKKPIIAESFYIVHGAPETIGSTRQISILTDIYQLGCTAYRLANGICEIKAEWQKDPESFVEEKAKGKIPCNKHKKYVPKKLALIINKALNVNPDKRFHSAIEMKHAIEKLHYPGYWTTNPENGTELIGYGLNYSYKYEVISKPNNLYDVNAYQINKTGRITKKTDFTKKNITQKDKERILDAFFEWVMNNAK